VSGAPERPELVRVGRRNGTRRLVLGLGVAAVLVGAAIWKPWDGARPVGAARATDLADATGSLLPAATSGSRGSLGAVGTPPPAGFEFAGLNLTIMGHADPHRDWGVAVAYVPANQISTATARGSRTVTPVVDWVLVAPGSPAPGPTMDHPGVVSVAVTATWPDEVSPVALRLMRADSAVLSNPAPSRSPIRSPIPSVTPPTCCLIAFGPSLLAMIADRVPAFSSGEFFLPPVKLVPLDPAGWLGKGWPAGAYAFEVESGSGVVMTLPFTIGG
jgi:hypothetical protein